MRNLNLFIATTILTTLFTSQAHADFPETKTELGAMFVVPGCMLGGMAGAAMVADGRKFKFGATRTQEAMIMVKSCAVVGGTLGLVTGTFGEPNAAEVPSQDQLNDGEYSEQANE